MPIINISYIYKSFITIIYVVNTSNKKDRYSCIVGIVGYSVTRTADFVEYLLLQSNEISKVGNSEHPSLLNSHYLKVMR